MFSHKIDAKTSPFHEGELDLQRRYGVEGQIDSYARQFIRDHLTEQHRDFYEMLPMLIMATVDADGQPWATLVAGMPGFMETPNARSLQIDALPVPNDPVADLLRVGARIGGLGLQFETRRRNRFSAHVSVVSDTGFTLTMDQAFGNCPQYIVNRNPVEWADRTPGAPVPQQSLDAEARRLIAAADTFFVASAAPASEDKRDGVDVSHRGGKPGFVKVEGDTLVIPDFSGNHHFNTLGNFMRDPRAGLTFVDFETGDMLFLTGTAEIQFEGPEVAAFKGAERIWRFTIDYGTRLPSAFPLRYAGGKTSPMSLATGDWASADEALAADRDRLAWRPLRVVAMRDESAEVRSIWLEPQSGAGVLPYLPGQHLPVRLSVTGQSQPVLRCYTISNAHDGHRYRLSVKREAGGVASPLLHKLRVGDTVEAQAPRGSFVLEETSPRPILMISAGVGITPMIAMLERLLGQGSLTRYKGQITHIHAARNGKVMAFGDLLRQASGHPRYRSHILFDAPEAGDRIGKSHDSVGRVDADMLRSLVATEDYEVYLCGPSGFMRGVYDTLRDLGVSDRRIRFESFGPASVERRPDADAAQAVALPTSATVRFAGTQSEATWSPDQGSLLELAEKAGIDAPFGCRNGTCGSCATRLIEGEVHHTGDPSAPRAEGEVLLCCAKPKTALVLDL